MEETTRTKKIPRPRSKARATWMATALVALVALVAEVAAAQAPRLNLGHGFQPRLFNASRYDSDLGRTIGTTRLIVNTFLDIAAPTSVRLVGEQGGHEVLATLCEADWIHDTSLRGVDAQGQLWECATEFVDATTIRADQPMDLVLRAGDAEIYRGTFPVVAFHGWEGMRDGQPLYVEQRALRLDSLYGAGYLRQYLHHVEFTYATTQTEVGAPQDPAFRCTIGGGPASRYDVEFTRGNPQEAFDRVFVGETIAENKLVTEFLSFQVDLPVAVAGRSHRPRATGTDGAWVCELEASIGDRRAILRDFRFEVRGGFIVPSALESEVPAGQGSVLVTVGFHDESMPTVFDPALVRSTLVGRRLASGTSLVSGTLPSRATNPAFTRVGGASNASSSGGRPPRGGRRPR